MENRLLRFYRDLGGNIAAARQASGMTQAELAAATGFARTTIVAIERGRQMMPIHDLLEIASVLRVDPWPMVPSSPTAGPTTKTPELDPATRLWLDRLRRSDT